MLAGLTTDAELLMLAFGGARGSRTTCVIDRCRCSTAGSSSTTSRAGMCLYGHGPDFFKPFHKFSRKRNEQQLCLAAYGPLVEFPRESNG